MHGAYLHVTHNMNTRLLTAWPAETLVRMPIPYPLRYIVQRTSCDVYPAINIVMYSVRPRGVMYPITQINFTVPSPSWETVPPLVNKFPTFYGSSQKPAKYPYLEPHPIHTFPSYFLQQPLQYYPAIEAQVLQAVASPSVRFPHQNSVRMSLLHHMQQIFHPSQVP